MTTVVRNNYRSHSVYFEPVDKSKVISRFMVEYRSSSSVKSLLSEMRNILNLKINDPVHIEVNECHFYVHPNKVIFDMEYVTELKPIELDIESTFAVFESYYDYLIQYENCKIPGLIPLEKLEEWRSVPLYQIKDEYR